MTTTNTPARTYIVYSATNAVLAAIDPHTGEPLSSRRAHELATLYGAGAWICRAGVDVQVANPQPAADSYARSITFAPATNDFRMELDGQLVGYARTYQEAEITLGTLVHDLIERLAEMEAGAEAHHERLAELGLAI